MSLGADGDISHGGANVCPCTRDVDSIQRARLQHRRISVAADSINRNPSMAGINRHASRRLARTASSTSPKQHPMRRSSIRRSTTTARRAALPRTRLPSRWHRWQSAGARAVARPTPCSAMEMAPGRHRTGANAMCRGNAAVIIDRHAAVRSPTRAEAAHGAQDATQPSVGTHCTRHHR